MMDKKISNINDYSAKFPKDIQLKIFEIKKIVKIISPEAIELISYNMPAFKLNKNILIYFAVHKNHIGFYPYPSAIKEYKKELVNFETSKGGIKFPLDKKLPINLIKKIIKFRVNENLSKN